MNLCIFVVNVCKLILFQIICLGIMDVPYLLIIIEISYNYIVSTISLLQHLIFSSSSQKREENDDISIFF